MKKIQPISISQINNLDNIKYNQICNDINHAIVALHALLHTAQIEIDFLRHYQFMINNKKFKRSIINLFNHHDAFVFEINKVFNSNPMSMKTLPQQHEFSYELLEHLEKCTREFTDNHLGFSFTIDKEPI